MALVVLVVVVAVVLRQGAATREASSDVVFGGADRNVLAPALADVVAPPVSDERGGIAVSAAGVGTTGDAPVDVRVYLDFMCPFCGQFEALNGPMLADKVEAGQIAVTYHVVSFLDSQSSGTSCSTRAAIAAAVVAARGPESYADFMSALFADAPPEGSAGLTGARIAEIAVRAGVPADVAEQFTATTSGTYTADGELSKRHLAQLRTLGGRRHPAGRHRPR